MSDELDRRVVVRAKGVVEDRVGDVSARLYVVSQGPNATDCSVRLGLVGRSYALTEGDAKGKIGGDGDVALNASLVVTGLIRL